MPALAAVWEMKGRTVTVMWMMTKDGIDHGGDDGAVDKAFPSIPSSSSSAPVYGGR